MMRHAWMQEEEPRMDLYPKLISLLLQYPDEELVRGLNEIEAAVSELESESARKMCTDLLDHLRRTPLIQVQEEYTRTFDLDPSMCLNLSHQKWGDDRERGSGLAALSGLYRAAGFEMSTGELPDYLPLVLEFLSVCPEGAGEMIKTDYRRELASLADGAGEGGSPYAALLGLAADFFGRRPEEHGT